MEYINCSLCDKKFNSDVSTTIKGNSENYDVCPDCMVFVDREEKATHYCDVCVKYFNSDRELKTCPCCDCADGYFYALDKDEKEEYAYLALCTDCNFEIVK